ncbi:MAG: tetratricopeptide repeat protein [Candidatus Omnitrophica bacterium]|nr:tetratricopeptide repeat protein [Candidatus Omnitrophota bacterium]
MSAFNFFDQLLKTNLRVFCLIGLFVFTAYSFMLESPFKTMDDDFSIVNNAEIRSLGYIPSYFRSTYFKKSDKDYYRPMVYVTYALEYHFFNLNHFFYNLDNIFLHIFNACLVFLLALLLLKDRFQSFAAAFLFAVHPVQWEAVGNISGRAILLSAFFVLSGFYCFIKFVRERRIGFLLAAALCYVLGLCSKESSGVLILTIAAFGLCLEDRAKEKIPQAIILGLAVFAAIAAAYLGLRHIMGIAQIYPWPNKTLMLLGVTTFLKGVFIYVRLFFLPLGLHFDRGLVMFKSVGEWQFWLTLLAWGLLAGGLWKNRKEFSDLTIFCLLWFAIELFPVSQVMTSIGVSPGKISLAEHFLYVASVPALIVMVRLGVWVYTRVLERKTASPLIMRLGLGGFFVFLYLTLISQNIYASNDYFMMRDSLNADPQNARIQYSMGLIYVKARNYPEAVRHFKQASDIFPEKDSYRIAYAKALTDGGELLKAAQVYETIAGRDDLNDLLKDNKTALYRLLVADYTKKIKTAPQDPGLKFALGVFYSKLLRHKEAAQAYQAALALKPDYDDALFNLAVTFDALSDISSAKEAYARLAISPTAREAFRRKAIERLRVLNKKG